jgi:hypothetical protein
MQPDPQQQPNVHGLFRLSPLEWQAQYRARKAANQDETAVAALLNPRRPRQPEAGRRRSRARK